MIGSSVVFRTRSWIVLCLGLLVVGSPAALAADCPGHPDALGTSRTLVVDPREHPRIGTMQYRETLPLIPGAVDAVRRIAGGWRLGLASSSNREIIDLVLEHAGLTDAFAVTVSSEEVARGKPAPDVYLEAARRLGADPARCVAIEDSSNGLRSAAGAGTAVVAIPNREFPPDPDALALAGVVLGSIEELAPDVVRPLR